MKTGLQLSSNLIQTSDPLVIGSIYASGITVLQAIVTIKPPRINNPLVEVEISGI